MPNSLFLIFVLSYLYCAVLPISKLQTWDSIAISRKHANCFPVLSILWLFIFTTVIQMFLVNWCWMMTLLHKYSHSIRNLQCCVYDLNTSFCSSSICMSFCCKEAFVVMVSSCKRSLSSVILAFSSDTASSSFWTCPKQSQDSANTLSF